MKNLSNQFSWYSSTKQRMYGSLSTNKSSLILISSYKSNSLINGEDVIRTLFLLKIHAAIGGFEAIS